MNLPSHLKLTGFKSKPGKEKKNTCQFGCHFLIYEFHLTFWENLKQPDNGNPELQRHGSAGVQHGITPDWPNNSQVHLCPESWCSKIVGMMSLWLSSLRDPKALKRIIPYNDFVLSKVPFWDFWSRIWSKMPCALIQLWCVLTVWFGTLISSSGKSGKYFMQLMEKLRKIIYSKHTG